MSGVSFGSKSSRPSAKLPGSAVGMSASASPKLPARRPRCSRVGQRARLQRAEIQPCFLDTVADQLQRAGIIRSATSTNSDAG
jgi:hypothetical protein